MENGEWRIEEGEEEVEGIGDAVGEATEDEDGDTEEEGEHLTLSYPCGRTRRRWS